jgi:hypothetical protein
MKPAFSMNCCPSLDSNRLVYATPAVSSKVRSRRITTNKRRVKGYVPSRNAAALTSLPSSVIEQITVQVYHKWNFYFPRVRKEG